MKRLLKNSVIFIFAALIIISAFPPRFYASESGGFDFLEYPDEALTDFSGEILTRISSGDDYISNCGYDETSLYISPHWSMTVNGKSVPVYSTAVYDWVLDRGVIQSFEYIFADENALLSLELTFLSGGIKNVTVLPEKYGVKAQIKDNRIVTEVCGTGTYTFLINDDSQEYAVTVFVRENSDEDAETEFYKEKYGEENVEIFESGYYEADSIPSEKDVIYFKRGAFVSFNHKNDIRCDADAENSVLPPVLEMNGKENAVIAGCGTFDFTKIDRRERNLVTVNFCRNSEIDGLILLNPNSWTVTAYACENCSFRNITVFGYRTNSDGINICGCRDISVENCFCRNGDDCFSAKTTNEFFECSDVEFRNCIGWSNKARCFGITGEVVRDIYNISFKDCSVIFRNANWDYDRTASLAVAVETGGAKVDNILFENIEIHNDTGRPIYCMIYGSEITDCTVKNVIFRNIKINCGEKIKISSQRGIDFIGKIAACASKILKNSCLKNCGFIKKIISFLGRFFVDSNSVNVSFENVSVNGKKVSSPRLKYFIAEGNTEIKFIK